MSAERQPMSSSQSGSQTGAQDLTGGGSHEINLQGQKKIKGILLKNMGMFLFCPTLNSFIFLYKSSNNKKI